VPARGATALAALAALAAGAALAAACASARAPAAEDERSASVEVLGSLYTLRVRDPDAGRAEGAVTAALGEIERVAWLLDASEPGGEVALLNAVPSRVWIAVSEETAAALRRACALARASDGYFDPTLGPVLRAWGLRGGTPRVPTLPEIKGALRNVGWDEIEVRDDEPAVRRTSRRLEIDLGRFGRGVVLDAALAKLRAAGVPAALAAAAEVHAAYGGSEARPWWIELAHPDTGRPLAELELREGGLAVVAPQPVQVDGVAVHEGIDPWTGRPAHGARLVAAVAGDAASAGGWATAIFAMGEDGPAFARQRESGGVAALLLLESGERQTAPGLRVRWTGSR
jgi:FAD:protein FMN transferase